MAGSISCEVCSAGTQKMKKLSRRQGRWTVHKVFDTIVTDHAGPYPSQIGGFRYLSVFVDSSPSRFCFIFKAVDLRARSTVEHADHVYEFVQKQTKHEMRSFHVEVAPSKFRDERAVRHLQKNFKLL